MRVAVVDDRSLLVSGLEVLLNRYRDIQVVEAGELRPGDTIITGTAAVTESHRFGLRVVELSPGVTVEDLARAVTGNSSGRIRNRRRGQPLSQREQIVLDMTSNGSSAAQIAARLEISVRTVERHRRAVVEKLAVRSSAQAVAVGAKSVAGARQPL